MALMKMCPRCHSKFEYGQSCPNMCMEKRRKLDNKVYDKFQRKNRNIYSSARWQRLRDTCIARDNICLWSYYKYRKVVQGRDVHHIVEVEDDKNRSFDINNLIFVSDAAHREIHKLYNNGEKERVQKELLEMVAKSKRGGDL